MWNSIHNSFYFCYILEAKWGENVGLDVIFLFFSSEIDCIF